MNYLGDGVDTSLMAFQSLLEGGPSLAASGVEGVLTGEELKLLKQMREHLEAKRWRNRLRQSYYDQKVLLKDLGISVPPQLKRMESVLGWPAKTVDVLADRIRFEKFVAPDQEDDAFGLEEIILENDFRNGFSGAVSSSLTHSCAFLTVTQGDVEAGEPEILWLPKSAHDATGIWDPRRRALKAGLSVTGRDAGREPTGYVVYFPDKTVVIEIEGKRPVMQVLPNPTGRVLMEPLASGSDLRRPFGRSRITRSVMSLTDSAIRTIVRSEIGAEFFASPQRYVLGADEEAFAGKKWNALTSRLLTISRDEEGNLPTVNQFSQISMQPHTDQLRQWAALLAAESQIPLDELGFPSDNPSSDSAIQSQRDPLRLAADRMIRGYESALHRLAVTTVMLRDGAAPEGLSKVRPWFAPTVHVSDASAADAVLKQVQVMPWLAESSVILEKLGYSQSAIDRLLADKRRAQGANTLAALAQASAGAPASPQATEEEENELLS